MARPSAKGFEALDAYLPALARVDADYPSQARPGESLEAFRQRHLPPRLFTLIAAVEGELLRKEKVRGQAAVPENPPPQTDLDRLGQARPDPDRRKRQTAAGRAARLRADRQGIEERRAMVLRRFGGRGMAARAVARALNEDGIALPQGGRWTATAVLNLVTLEELAVPRDRSPHYRKDPRQIDWTQEITQADSDGMK